MRPDFDILVVDDEPVVLAAAKKVLDPEGLSVDDAPNAGVALKKMKRHTYGAVLCDLKLPEDGAPAVLDFARKHLPDTPVVVITGYATLKSAMQSFDYGAFDFLPKPFDVDELLDVVRRALRDRAAPPGM